MSTPSIVPMMTSIDHAHLRRIASAGMRIRRAPPSAQILAIELERARVVDPVRLPSNVISMHSVFDFRDGITEQVRRAMLVYPGEEDAGLGRISVLSPLGAALIGLAEGQSLAWRSATGARRTLHVIQVVHQPEREDMSQGDMMQKDMKDAAVSARDNSGRVIP
ncbi:nucleoside diphosphate kinase regulator [Microvirga sp. TS319]|uniref:nucleoside diphosphate kinase regulator n=1 Tax=Microvirga sp. TS319 TaxID=3241165 RepID=UPI00351A92B8